MPGVMMRTSTPLLAARHSAVSISWSRIRYGVVIYTYSRARSMMLK